MKVDWVFAGRLGCRSDFTRVGRIHRSRCCLFEGNLQYLFIFVILFASDTRKVQLCDTESGLVAGVAYVALKQIVDVLPLHDGPAEVLAVDGQTCQCPQQRKLALFFHVSELFLASNERRCSIAAVRAETRFFCSKILARLKAVDAQNSIISATSITKTSCPDIIVGISSNKSDYSKSPSSLTLPSASPPPLLFS